MLSSFLSATHIHSDEHLAHNNCKICIVVKNLHSGDTPDSVTLSTIESIYHQEIALSYSLPVQVVEKGFDAQAPPRFS